VYTFVTPSVPPSDTSYTRYPLATSPLLTDGADHDNEIDDAVCCVDVAAPGTADAVDTGTSSLRSLRPASLTAAIENLYRFPPSRPLATIDVPAVRVGVSVLPSFRYTTYPVTADAPSSVTEALHANAILDVVCRVLRSAVGAAGDVD